MKIFSTYYDVLSESNTTYDVTRQIIMEHIWTEIFTF